LRWESIWRNVPRICLDFGSALLFQTRLTQTKPGSTAAKRARRTGKGSRSTAVLSTKHKKFPYLPARDISLLSGHGYIFQRLTFAV
jgi:hypothetical protein